MTHRLPRYWSAIRWHRPLTRFEEETVRQGERYWVETFKSPVLDPGGAAVGTIGFSRDISAHRLTERALLRQREQLRLVLDHAPVGILILKERIFQDFNETLLRMTGYTREELIGQSTRLLYPSETDFARVGEEVYDKLGTHTTGSTETRMRRKDGSLFDVIISWAPLDPSDLSKGITFSLQDITSQKQTERALRESEAKFHTMVDWTLDWEYWLSPDGRLYYMTPSAEELTGYTVADFEQNPELLNAIVHPKDRRSWAHHIQEHSSQQRHPDQLDFRLVKKSGEVIWVTHRCRPVFGVDGDYQGRRVTVRDMTAPKRYCDGNTRSMA